MILLCCWQKPKSALNSFWQNMTQLNAEHRPEPCRATSEAMWDKTDIWVKCHITEVKCFPSAAVITPSCAVGTSAGEADCQHQLLTSNPWRRPFRTRFVFVPAEAILRARWRCSSCGFPCSRRAWWSCSPASAPADAPPEWRSSRLTWPSTCASCSAPVNWCVCWFWVEREKNNFIFLAQMVLFFLFN